MNVVGLGLDLVDIARVERMVERHGNRFLDRVLTRGERAYCAEQVAPARHIAARLAAKEAAFKAFQHGARVPGIGWLNTAVVRDDAGRPGLRFHGLAAETAKRLGVQAALVSLSHTDLQAAAVVILVAP